MTFHMILNVDCQLQYTVFVVILVDIWVSAQSCKFLWSGFAPRWFSWVKGQPICKSNMITHTSVYNLGALYIWSINMFVSKVNKQRTILWFKKFYFIIIINDFWNTTREPKLIKWTLMGRTSPLWMIGMLVCDNALHPT